MDNMSNLMIMVGNTVYHKEVAHVSYAARSSDWISSAQKGHFLTSLKPLFLTFIIMTELPEVCYPTPCPETEHNCSAYI